jgi:hypothetical protein
VGVVKLTARVVTMSEAMSEVVATRNEVVNVVVSDDNMMEFEKNRSR